MAGTASLEAGRGERVSIASKSMTSSGEELPSGRIAELEDLKDKVPARFLNQVYEETALRVAIETEKRQLGRKGQSVTMAEKVCHLILLLRSCC